MKKKGRGRLCLELFWEMLMLSTFTTGGGFVIVTFMKRKFVDEFHWIDDAEMLDITCIVFSRGKQPSEEILEMAQEADIAVLSTRMTTYTACGELYTHGLPGTREKTN